MKIKICGIRTIEAANAAIEAGATHIGFIFFSKSPRNISAGKAAEIAHHVKGKIKTVIVTVNADDEFLSGITSVFKPDYIQMHGSETPARAREIKRKFSLKIIKAISVSDKKDISAADNFKNVADYILFDAKPSADSLLPGGNARAFNWNILSGFQPEYQYILSGGLTTKNVKNAVNITGASFVDVSSGVESSPGNKDISMIRSFIAAAID